MTLSKPRLILFKLSLLTLLTACVGEDTPSAKRFTIAVIPDTQNAVDYTRQKAEGFAIDSSEIFIEEMRHIASRGAANGGDIVFVASVGDVWQHQTSTMDKAHFDRGVTSIDNPFFADNVIPHSEALTIEIPKAIEGYRLIDQADIPFGVAPGNHDYDAIWAVAAFPPNLSKSQEEITRTIEDMGTLHIGGLATSVAPLARIVTSSAIKSGISMDLKAAVAAPNCFPPAATGFCTWPLKCSPATTSLPGRKISSSNIPASPPSSPPTSIWTALGKEPTPTISTSPLPIRATTTRFHQRFKSTAAE